MLLSLLKRCAALTLFCLGFNALAVPPEGYLVQAYDVDSGLPDSSVTSIAQTPDGYLWVGTVHGGLARFDGQRFVTFDPGNTPELHSIEIEKLLVDGLGTLWIGTVEGALVSYRGGQFHFEQQNTETPQAWLNKVISSTSNSVLLASYYGWLFQGTVTDGTNHWESRTAPGGDPSSSPCRDRDGTIWYRGRDASLNQFRDNKFVRLTNPPGLRGSKVNALLTDAAGQLWVGTEKELARWDGEKFLNLTPTNGPMDLNVNQMAACPDGSLWVRSGREFKKYRDLHWVAQVDDWGGAGPQLSDHALMLNADSHGGLWVSHYQDGVWHADADGRGSQVRLPNTLVECWFEDHEGNVWLGLGGGSGLVCLRKPVFHTIWPTDMRGQVANRSICEDQSGAMWFGTSENILLRWRDGLFTTFTPPHKKEAGFDTIVFPGEAGQLLVGSVLNGLMLFNDEKFTRPFPASDIGAVARVIYKDTKNRVWIGSEFGLFCWDRGELKRYTEKNGFMPAYVLAITEDKTGAIWIGTAMGELRRFKDEQFRSYFPKDSRLISQVASPLNADSFKGLNRGSLSGGERFWSLYADPQGVIWIGSLGGGLLRFEDGKFTRFISREGLPNDYISQILEDQFGRLWLGSRNGIVRVNKTALNQYSRSATNSLRFVSYGKSDGLPTAECSGGGQPACWRSKDNRLWFATAKGAAWIDPAEVVSNNLLPTTVIEEIYMDGRLQTRNQQPLRSVAVRPPTRLTLPPGRHYLEFKFTAPILTSPDQVKFRWKLVGLETAWARESHGRSANYSFVPPGDYEFQVQACNRDGVWNTNSASVQLTLLPYIWQTWWFKSGSWLLGFSLVAGTAFWNLRRRQRLQLQRLEHARARTQERLEYQQAMERERARIAQDLHDDLGASLTQVAWLGELANQKDAPADERQNLMTQITGQSRDMVRAIDEIVWAVNPKNDSLDHLVTYTCEFAEQFFRDTSTRCRVDVQEELPSCSLPSDVRHNLFLALKEALHNVAKHARARHVWVRVKVVGSMAHFVIEDDGVGFVCGEKNRGDGLKNLRDRAAAIGAEFELHSKPGEGTFVSWKLSLGMAGSEKPSPGLINANH
ncbi:MAG TPA: two-component regulator propeller domain-containing protein [Verrucomicrobiae bacterium]|nr:two-component regulator propeller domain-containing protein [Verrucomicrobiae bacterium]